MADFAELMALLREPGEDGLPENFADQLQSAYDETVDTYDRSNATLSEQVEGLTSERDEAITGRKAAQAHNSRLLRQIPAQKKDPEPDSDDDDNDGDDGSGDGEPQPITIESMIEYR